MQAARQQARGLAHLLQLAQPAAQGCTPAAAAAWQATAAAALSTSAARWAAKGGFGSFGGGGGGGSSGGGITGWLTSKVSGFMGGGELEDLDIETFAKSIKTARKVGGLGGFAHGTSAIQDGAAQGTLRLFEQVIDAMTPEEKKDVTQFGAEGRARVAAQVGATTSQVDDCIARYLWTRQLTLKMADLRRAGKEVPTSIDDVERMLGTWRQYKTQHEAADGSAAAQVPLGHQSSRGKPCPLAGVPVGKNTKCPATKKAFKACCGRTLKL